jgi:hypothetical protein
MPGPVAGMFFYLYPKAFVRFICKIVLNTDTPDAQGLARWVGELTATGDARSSRTEVALGFSQSPKFEAANTAPGLKEAFRPGTFPVKSRSYQTRIKTSVKSAISLSENWMVTP